MSHRPRALNNLISAERLAGLETVAEFCWHPIDEPRRPDPAQPRPARGALTGYGLDELVEEAAEIIAEAQAQAEQIVAEARRRAEAAHDELAAEALAEAKRQVAAEGVDAAELARIQRLFAQAVGELEARLEAHLAELQANVLKTAFEIAGTLVHSELTARPELVVESVRRALADAGAGELTVRIHPEDMPHVQAALLDLQRERKPDDYISFEADASIERGGCVVAGPNGAHDAQPGSKLARLRDMAQ